MSDKPSDKPPKPPSDWDRLMSQIEEGERLKRQIRDAQEQAKKAREWQERIKALRPNSDAQPRHDQGESRPIPPNIYDLLKGIGLFFQRLKDFTTPRPEQRLQIDAGDSLPQMEDDARGAVQKTEVVEQFASAGDSEPEDSWESLTPPEQNRRNWQAMVKWTNWAKAILSDPGRAWRKIRLWQVLAFLIAILIGIGYQAVGMNPAEFFTARISFVAAEVLLLVLIVHWSLVSTKNNIERLILCVGLGGLTLFVLVQTLLWVNRRESDKSRADIESTTELLRRYPLGYAIYELNFYNQVLPYTNRLPSNYRVDWETARIAAVTDTRVTVMLPNVFITGSDATFFSNLVPLPKEVGVSADAINIDGIQQSVELLAIRETGFVFLIGFKN